MNKEIKQFLNNYFPSYHLNKDPYEKIIVSKDKEIIGVISYSIIYERAEINYIVIKEDKRGQGKATELLNKAIKHIEKSGCHNITLEVETTNAKAIHLYEKNGFQKQTIRKKYYQNKDAYLMIRKLR